MITVRPRRPSTPTTTGRQLHDHDDERVTQSRRSAPPDHPARPRPTCGRATAQQGAGVAARACTAGGARRARPRCLGPLCRRRRHLAPAFPCAGRNRRAPGDCRPRPATCRGRHRLAELDGDHLSRQRPLHTGDTTRPHCLGGTHPDDAGSSSGPRRCGHTCRDTHRAGGVSTPNSPPPDDGGGRSGTDSSPVWKTTCECSNSTSTSKTARKRSESASPATSTRRCAHDGSSPGGSRRFRAGARCRRLRHPDRMRQADRAALRHGQGSRS